MRRAAVTHLDLAQVDLAGRRLTVVGKGGGHPFPPRILIGGRSRQRGAKTHDTTAAGHRHSKRSGL
jgi:hypothetical protein